MITNLQSIDAERLDIEEGTGEEHGSPWEGEMVYILWVDLEVSGYEIRGIEWRGWGSRVDGRSIREN